MMGKRGQHDEVREAEEIIEALREKCEEVLEGADIDDRFLFYWTDQNHNTAYLVCSDGGSAFMPYAEFQDIKNGLGAKCLFCNGILGFNFDFNAKPLLFLECESCYRAHKVISGMLYMYVR